MFALVILVVFAPLFHFPKTHILKQVVTCGNDLAVSVFFNVRMASKPPAEFYPPICVFMELSSNANFPCLVNLALNVISVKFS